MQVTLGAQCGAAPGAGQRLEHLGALAVPGVLGLADLLLRLVETVRGDRAAHPEADPEGGGPPADVAAVVGLAAQDFGGADQRRRPLELLGGEQPQGVPHQHGDAGLAAAGVLPRADGPLEAADGEGEGREPEVGLGLAAAGGEEQQVDDAVRTGLALLQRRVGERPEVEEDEGQLERAPRCGFRALGVDALLGLLEGDALPLPQGRDGGVLALEGHRPVGEAERFQHLGAFGVREGVHAEGDPDGDVPGPGHRVEGTGAQRPGQLLRLRLPLVEPGAVAVGERSQGLAQRGRGQHGELVHGQLDAVQVLRVGPGRGDRRRHVVDRQPGGREGVGAALALVDGDRHGHVAARRVLQVVAVEQRQVLLLQVGRAQAVLGGLLGLVQRVGDRQEDRRPAVGRGDVQLGLEQPGRVLGLLGFVLRVDERQLDDAARSRGTRPVAYLRDQPYAGGVLLVGGERQDLAGRSVDRDGDELLHLLPGPGGPRHAFVVQDLRAVVLPPPHPYGHRCRVVRRREGEHQAHRRCPHPPRVLGGEPFRESLVGAVALPVGVVEELLVGSGEGGAQGALRADPPDEVPVTGAGCPVVELLVRSVPRAQQVPADELAQVVPDLVGGRRYEVLRHLADPLEEVLLQGAAPAPRPFGGLARRHQCIPLPSLARCPRGPLPTARPTPPGP